jgi:hypothetical protein
VSFLPNMKAGLKKLGWVVGVVGLALVILLALAMTSPVQTWVARRVLASQPDLGAEVGKVRIGLHQLNLEQTQLNLSGAVLTLPQLQAELPVVSAAWNGEIAISKLVARGWTLDLTGYAPALAKTASVSHRRVDFSLVSTAHAAAEALPVLEAAFAGIFVQLDLPVDFSLDGAILEGEVILPAGPEHTRVTLRVSLLGGGLRAGHEGVFTVDAQTELAGMGGPVDRLKVSGTLSALMDSPRTFSKFSAKLNSNAVGEAFPSGVQLSADLSAAKVNGGEDYALTLQTVGKRLLDVQANLPANASRFGGVWRLDMRDTDVAPFVLGRSLPTFEAVGAGMFEADTQFAEIHTAGRIKTALDRLDVMDPLLAKVGAVTLFSEFDLTQMDKLSRVDKLKVDINRPQPVLALEALQPFEFNMATGELKVADPSANLLSLDVQGMPVDWVGTMLASLKLSKGTIHGQFVASAGEGGVKVRTDQALRIENLNVSSRERALGESLDISMDLLADYNPGGWRLTVDGLKVASAGTDLITVNLQAGQLLGPEQPIKVSGSTQIFLAPSSRQPVIRDAVAINAGTLSADFALNSGIVQDIQSKFRLVGLTDAAGLVMPTIESSMRATINEHGVIKFYLPLNLTTGARISDLDISGVLQPEQEGYAVNSKLSGKLVYLEDLQVLASLAAAPATLASPGPADVRDDKPFWEGLSGVIELALSRVRYNEHFEFKDVAGRVRINAGALNFDDVHAATGDKGAIKVEGGVTFDPALPEPYGFNSAVQARDFDSAALFAAYDPGITPPVDGRFNFTTTLLSRAQNLESLANRAQGDVQLTSTSGVFRLLSAPVSSQVDNVGKVAAVGAFLGNVVGVLGKNKDAVGLANKAQAVAEFSQLLNAIKYDQLNVAVVRDADLTMRLQEFTLIAPEMRLTGGGQLQHQDDLDFMHQPLTLALEMKARGRTAEVLRYLNLLATEKDDLGYAACTLPLRVTGTLLKPDTTELKNALVKVAMESGGAGDLFNRLLGK